MSNSLGFSREGLDLALDVKSKYRSGQPLCVPGDDLRLLMPEHLLNLDIDLEEFEDPLPLAVVATRDPDSPMAVAAAVRMGPLAARKTLISGVFRLLGETTKHPVVRQCVDLLNQHNFDQSVIDDVRRKALRYTDKSRQQYTATLRQNLRALINGDLDSRSFVADFFELTEAGNLRIDIRTRLVFALLKSPNVRPSIKFLFLENFDKLPPPVRHQLIDAIRAAEPTPQIEMILDEIAWIEKEMPTAAVH